MKKNEANQCQRHPFGTNQPTNQPTKPLSFEEALKKLRPREIEVLQLVERGYTDMEIALELSLSVRTVHAHKRRIHEVVGLSGCSAILKWLWRSKNGGFSVGR